MNKYIKGVLALFGVLAMTACSSDAADQPDGGEQPQMREISVNLAPLSRTTIDYENVDLSHLVWSDGDRVAYVSDAPGDVCRVAAVRQNTFTATLPANVFSGNLHIIYPVGDNEGKTLAELRASVASQVTQAVDKPFDGSTLPMTSVEPITESHTIYANFEFPASVIRLKLNVGDDHNAEEALESVSLTAAEDMAGTYSFTNGEWAFTGASKSITTTIQGASTKLVDMQKNGNYVYIVMNRGEYSDVDLLIKTSTGSYRFDDGRMNLAQPGRTLYHIDLTLSESRPVSKPTYKKITSIEELTTFGTDSYLIVCEAKSMIVCDYDNSNYYPGVTVSIPAGGIDPADNEVAKRKCIIAPAGSDHPGMYSLQFADITSRGTYLGCMPNFSGTPGRLYFDASFDGTLDFWTITFDAEGNALLKANPRNNEIGGDVYLGLNASGDYSNCFCTYGTDAPAGTILPIQIYKLKN